MRAHKHKPSAVLTMEYPWRPDEKRGYADSRTKHYEYEGKEYRLLIGPTGKNALVRTLLCAKDKEGRWQKVKELDGDAENEAVGYMLTLKKKKRERVQKVAVAAPSPTQNTTATEQSSVTPISASGEETRDPETTTTEESEIPPQPEPVVVESVVVVASSPNLPETSAAVVGGETNVAQQVGNAESCCKETQTVNRAPKQRTFRRYPTQPQSNQESQRDYYSNCPRDALPPSVRHRHLQQQPQPVRRQQEGCSLQ